MLPTEPVSDNMRKFRLTCDIYSKILNFSCRYRAITVFHPTEAPLVTNIGFTEVLKNASSIGLTGDDLFAFFSFSSFCGAYRRWTQRLLTNKSREDFGETENRIISFLANRILILRLSGARQREHDSIRGSKWHIVNFKIKTTLQKKLTILVET
jgi:hypothetical protein